MAKRQQFWFYLTLGCGAALALGMLINSVTNYAFVARRMAIEQVRRELSRQTGALEGQLRKLPPSEPERLEPAVAEFRRGADGFAWIGVRTREGKLLAYDGVQAGATFTEERVRAGLRARQPITATRQLPGGEVVVELFPVRLAAGGGSQPSMTFVEMGMWLDKANSTFWPIRRNLIINCSAALALLVALLVIGLRFRAYLKGRKLEQELDIARSVQQELLPSPAEAPSGIAVAAECSPASEIGGDLYDVFPTEDNNVALVVGDVSGKGIPAALLMGVIHGAVRSGNWYTSAAAHRAGSERLNRLLCERASNSRYASLFWGYWDRRTGCLHYINAGHCSPMVVRRSRPSEVSALNDGGPVLGLLPFAGYEQGRIALEPGDLLVMYSDGVVEAANEAGEEFGEGRLREVLVRSAGRGPAGIRDAVLAELRAFSGNNRHADDLTLVAAQFGEPAESRRPLPLSAAVAA